MDSRQIGFECLAMLAPTPKSITDIATELGIAPKTASVALRDAAAFAGLHVKTLRQKDSMVAYVPPESWGEHQRVCSGWWFRSYGE